jgi:hypothetical protein
MVVHYTPDEIRQKYEGVAARFDCHELPTELLGVRTLRRRLVRHARGQVLEIAVGTGKNLPYYPQALPDHRAGSESGYVGRRPRAGS